MGVLGGSCECAQNSATSVRYECGFPGQRTDGRGTREQLEHSHDVVDRAVEGRQLDRGAGTGLRSGTKRHAHRGRRRHVCAERVRRLRGHTVVGMDADLAKALGQLMGLKVNVVSTRRSTRSSRASSRASTVWACRRSPTPSPRPRQLRHLLRRPAPGLRQSSGGPNITSLNDLCGTSRGGKGNDSAGGRPGPATTSKCKSAGKLGVGLQDLQ